MMFEPAPVRSEAVAVREPVADSDPLERQVGERSRRLADREPRMCAALEQHHVIPENREHARHE